MTTLIPETENVKETETAKPEEVKVKKITKGQFIVNLYKGLPGKEGDEAPFEPIADAKELAKRVKEAEAKGYFKTKKADKTDNQYLSDVRWYLTDAAKRGLIEKSYKARPKKVVETTEETEATEVVQPSL